MTMPYWGFTRPATTVIAVAPSAWPSMSSAIAPSMASVPTESTCPHSAESYQVTGLNR